MASLETADAPFACTSCNRTGGPASLTSCAFGKPVTIEQAIQIAGHKATVMMFGLTKPDETITVKPFEVFQKELVLTSSYINPYTQRRALELIDSGRLDVSSMVAKVASLDELGAILSDPALRAMGKYIIDPSK